MKEASDEVLWSTSVFDLDIAKTGLYLFSRMETSKNKDLWNKRAEKWIKKVRTLTKKSMDFHSLILVMYGSHRCKTFHKFPVITTEIFCQISSQIELLYLQTSDTAEKYTLYSLSAQIPDLNKLSFLDEPFPFSNWQPSLMDINKLAVYELLLGKFIKMPDCCKAKINAIVSDKNRFKVILSSLTPENIGLKYMGGFVWSLIQNSLAFNFSIISAVVRSKS
ncbi:hypothetical protein FACS1894123_02610 [Bacteroidia bacterium]|nr:hypothetical protein FACS1894123_02610 [Bacteroidia bacterium]